MNKVKPLIYFLLGLILLDSPVLAQNKSKACSEIAVNVDVNIEGSSNVLVISFQDAGNYKIQLINSKGEIKAYKSPIIRDLTSGEYDLIITDTTVSNRCPYYKRIKIEGQ